MSGTPSHDFRPAASWQNLRRRAELLSALRKFFDEHGFLEVETPILSADTVVDRHIDPFWTTDRQDHADDSAGRLWLQTSPEFAMKRLLAAGAESIYQVARAFRRGERGRLHNSEFTLVEWYRSGDDMPAGMNLLSDLCDALLRQGAAEQVSYREVFLEHARVDPHRAPREELAAAVAARGLTPPQSLAAADRDAWLDYLLVELVEPNLGRDRPTIVYDYPASQAALARLRGDDPPVAERFELYVRGIELANGYHELLDAHVLRQRFLGLNQERLSAGKPALPVESRLVQAMQAGLPACCGVALGFDRLAMIAVGASSIEDVLAFPADRA